MKVTRAIGKVFKPLVNFPRWMGWNELKANGENINAMAKDVFKVKTAEHNDTYEQAVERLGLTEDDIKQRIKGFKQLAITYCIFGLALLGYAIYLGVVHHYILATFIAFMLSVLAFAFAYREHFWYFQMKTKKLGQTYKDWLVYTFKGSRK